MCKVGPEGSRRLGLQDFMTPKHRPPLPPGISWYSFLEAEPTPGTWTCRMLRKKSTVTPPGIDPETFRLVAQRLNHYATRILSSGCRKCWFSSLLTKNFIPQKFRCWRTATMESAVILLRHNLFLHTDVQLVTS